MGVNEVGFAYGADLSWVSQLEEQGVRWIDDSGRQKDPFEIAKKKGVNAVRFRIFVKPPQDFLWKKDKDTLCQLGKCDVNHVLEMAERAKEKGFQILLDFHYSDHFADPQFQDIPFSWESYSLDSMCRAIYSHTAGSLMKFRENGISPDWVQVGNEINMGVLLPQGSLNDAPETMTEFLNSGYDAVKEVFPKCQVITHLTAFHKAEYIFRFFDAFFENGGKTDILGFSHYPYWFNLYAKEEKDKVSPTAEFVYEHMLRYHEKYQRPIMICEIGEHEEKEQEAYDLLRNTIEGLKMLPDDAGLGLFYWEPEVNSKVLTDHYLLGAARLVTRDTLQFSKALDAYKDKQEGGQVL